MEKIVFFNHSGIGDIIVSKPFCKAICNIFKPKNVFYAHNYDYRITSDIANFLDIKKLPVNQNSAVLHQDTTTYINTFFSNQNTFSSNTIEVCYYEFLFNNFNDMLKSNFNQTLTDNVDELMLLANYNKDSFYKQKIPLLSDETKKKVLIYNQKTFAGQSDNAGMNLLIDNLCKRFESIIFYISNDHKPSTSNCFNLRQILTPSYARSVCDISDIAQISKFCNTIVGPANGPLMASWIRPNICNNRKTYIINSTIDYPKGKTQYFSKQRCDTIITMSTIEMFNVLQDHLSG